VPVKILFLESSLELVPEELHKEPDVIRSSRRYEVPPSRLVLDKSLHYKAMRKLDKRWKRGRPDILHVCLLVTMDSPLVREGLVEVYFHVLDGRVFKVRGDTRLPKHLDRFKGVMADLLRANSVPPGSSNPLIFKVADSLGEFVSRAPFLILWEKGNPATVDSIAREAIEGNAIIGIGAFPRGDFEEETLRLATKKYAIAGGYPMTAWSVAIRLLCALERQLGYFIT